MRITPASRENVKQFDTIFAITECLWSAKIAYAVRTKKLKCPATPPYLVDFEVGQSFREPQSLPPVP